MLSMILVILYSAFLLLVAYFATQNTSFVTLHFAIYSFKYIPLYLVILAALIIGLIFSWVVFTLKVISYALQIHEKESLVKEVKKKNAEIVKQIHQLELENTQLKTKYEITDDDDKSLT